MSVHRQPPGTPVGGQFAASRNPAPAGTLVEEAPQTPDQVAVAADAEYLLAQLRTARQAYTTAVEAQLAMELRADWPEAASLTWEVENEYGTPAVWVNSLETADGEDLNATSDDQAALQDIVGRYAEPAGWLDSDPGEPFAFELHAAIEKWRTESVSQAPRPIDWEQASAAIADGDPAPQVIDWGAAGTDGPPPRFL